MHIYKMKNPIKNYAWGSRTFISHLTGQETPSQEPQAELWMGSHPQGESLVECDSHWIPLSSLVSNNPDTVLGDNLARQFDNNLPFLFKILAIDHPLSIQTHPNDCQAIEGYERENQLKIPLSSAKRNFKDRYHKPELVCALTPLWAMCGFRTIESIQKNFEPLGSIIVPGQSIQSATNFFAHLMLLTDNDKSQLIDTAVQYGQTRRDQTQWQWVCRLASLFKDDIGVLAPLFLNTICLNPGEALFLEPGVLHAYLEGNAVEVMYNSDNVIRGGLTVKHIDIDTLLEIISPDGELIQIHPQMIQENQWLYQTPVNCFSLIRYNMPSGHEMAISVNGPEILLCVKGSLTIRQNENMITLKQGMSAFVSHETRSYELYGDGIIYKAFV